MSFEPPKSIINLLQGPPSWVCSRNIQRAFFFFHHSEFPLQQQRYLPSNSQRLQVPQWFIFLFDKNSINSTREMQRHQFHFIRKHKNIRLPSQMFSLSPCKKRWCATAKQCLKQSNETHKSRLLNLTHGNHLLS